MDRWARIFSLQVGFARGNFMNPCTGLTERGVRSSRPSDGVPLISVTTSGRACYRFFRVARIVAAMHRFPHTAGMLGRSGSLQHDRQECSGEREQQQKPCGETLHVSFETPEPDYVENTAEPLRQQGPGGLVTELLLAGGKTDQPRRSRRKPTTPYR